MKNFFRSIIDQVIKTLDKNNIDYLIIGGIAGIFYGLNRPTFDFDIIIKSIDVDDFIYIFYKKGFKVVKKMVKEKMICFKLPEKAIETINKEKPRAFKIAKSDLVGDIWFEPRIPFPRLEKNTVDFKIEGVTLKVVSKDDWIKLKKSAGREEDLKDIQFVEQIKEKDEK